ncbi:AMP-dependent synthetase/ligase [Thioalbus denitrificans]|uniref:Long-chain acyl-CoA synthetase n=1 Tax=Thioalbus denitrificans TaxID=547122 RepID=A0A369C8U0_9GAMM|nr:AMP-dependent synthetase/ligase [Thioalbus denitrificans]RCX30309.1 long-chain acyl-CoA synthetase [Thioalbus denitrificans]
MHEWNEDIIAVETAVTLDGLFRERIHRTPDSVAYRQFDRRHRLWVDATWSEVARQVARWQAGMAREALKPGDRVAIVLRNCREWVEFDQAALGLGLVVVPLYTDDRPDSAAYILNDSAAKLLLIQDDTQWRRLRSADESLPALRRVLVLEHKAGGADDDPRVIHVDEWLPRGEHEVRHDEHGSQSLASIVYTSGTTGRPKGVMLSHHNMLSIAHASLTMVSVYREDTFLSFLPLSHTLERTGGYYLPMMAGSTVAFSRSVQQLAEDLQTIRPTALISVPRIYERVYARLADQLEKKPLARILFRAAAVVGWRRFQAAQGRASRWLSPQLLLWPLLRRLVADKVLARLGGRLRVAVSGGAALPFSVARTFIGLGLPILQGYGLTETSPVVSVNTLEDNEPASVGLPLRGVEVKIGENDELLVRGPGVMQGYWNNHAATTQTIDSDGWLHTGDQARIEHGHLYITGRIKDILVLSNGEKVPPGDMESAIALDPLFDQVLVLGEGRPFLSALVVLNGEHWVTLARQLGLDAFDPASLLDNRLRNQLITHMRELLADFPGYAKVRRVVPMLDAWTVENGLLTPTLKTRRQQVLERYRKEVELLYGELA